MLERVNKITTEVLESLFKQKAPAGKLSKLSEKQIMGVVAKEIKNHRKKKYNNFIL
jgi:hypothetical protein